jgi:hypothetical protein
LGIYEEIKITPASITYSLTRWPTAFATTDKLTYQDSPTSSNALPKKKDIKTFNDLLNNFPMIARQMQPGLESVCSRSSTLCLISLYPSTFS